LSEEIQLGEDDFKTIEQLRSEGKWPLSYVSAKGLVPILQQGGDGLVGVEVGTCRAESTAYILDNCPNVKMITTVDPFQGYDDWAGRLSQDTMDKFHQITNQNLSQHLIDKRVDIFVGTSAEAIASFEDNSLDFIFIDGDHSYEGVYTDLMLWYPKIKWGGLFAGHDYNLTEVRNALTQFRAEKNILKMINTSENNAWWWYKS